MTSSKFLDRYLGQECARNSQFRRERLRRQNLFSPKIHSNHSRQDLPKVVAPHEDDASETTRTRGHGFREVRHSRNVPALFPGFGACPLCNTHLADVVMAVNGKRFRLRFSPRRTLKRASARFRFLTCRLHFS